MSAFKTYRVRYTEWQTLAINLSARSADDACELARQIRSDIGQEPFEEMDGAIEHFDAEEIDARDLPDPPRAAESALRFFKGQGGPS